MIETAKYARKPFQVDAVQVTAENINEVAEWCQGEVLTSQPQERDTAEPYIKVRVHRALNERQTKAFVGDWVLYAGLGYKVYTDKAFGKSFKPLEGTERDAATQAEKLQPEDVNA